MKSIRLKIILISVVISSGLVIYIWVQNLYQIDFLPSWNQKFYNGVIMKIETSDDIESVKTLAVNTIKSLKEKDMKDSKRAGIISYLIIIVFVMQMVLIVFTIIEIRKHRIVRNEV